MIKSVADIGNAYDAGRYHIQPFYKTWPSTYNIANAWWDATLAGILPRASYYPGDDYTFTLYPSGDHQSIFHGGNVTPYQKILRTINLNCSSANLAPSRYILCDYLGFYANISFENDSVQTLINNVTLPRYTDGKGVRAIMVQIFGSNTNAVYTINYRNFLDQDVTSPVQTGNALGTGSLQHGQISTTYNPFIDIYSGSGCQGIKRVNSVTVSSMGTGLATLVLVKPLAEISYKDGTLLSSVEQDYWTDKQSTPVIYDGAKLNFIFTSIGNPTTLFTRGYLDFIWG